MGSKYTGIMSLVYRQPELKKFLKGPGQPKVDWFVKATICIKVKQYSKNYKISRRQAFLKLCNLSSRTRKDGFYKLMDYHFKNKRHPGYWKNRMINELDTQINFYKNHVKKWL
jgi:hypothetical protein|tara:strand:+ start:21 stop:359 length:339 start_codon:yes stop_codon:yes gene_type:complete